MRRLFVLLLASVVLGACQEPILPPKEVLKRSFFVSHGIDNYAFSMQGTATLRGPRVLSGTLVADGVVKRGGAWSANVAIQSERIRGPQSDRIDGIAHVRMPGNGTLYVKTTGIAGEAGRQIAEALRDHTTEGWTRLIYPYQQSNADDTPTQERIDAQVESLVIVADRTDPESSFYEYDVELSPLVMQALFTVTDSVSPFRGTLFIDRRTFSLTRAKWEGSSLATPVGNLTLEIDVSFSLLNQSSLPSMPSFTGASLPLKTFFDIISVDLPLS